MDGMAWAASAMAAAKSRLEIAAGNLANVSSDGFRKQLARGTLSPQGAQIAAARSAEQGALRRTGRDLDVALAGAGTLTVRDAAGALTRIRGGSFVRDGDGHVRDTLGRVLLGAGGPVIAPPGAAIGTDGVVRLNGRELSRIPLPQGTTLHSGFLESSNVNAISEMVAILGAQRSFESAQKVVTAIDATRQKAGNELARLK